MSFHTAQAHISYGVQQKKVESDRCGDNQKHQDEGDDGKNEVDADSFFIVFSRCDLVFDQNVDQKDQIDDEKEGDAHVDEEYNQ